jgi:23S rRNA G2445 N2-methylase RlmL
MLFVFAITARGLEPVAAEEMAAAGLRVEETGYRRVRAACQGPMRPLLKLRTLDDLFLEVETWLGIDRPRSALDAVRTMSGRLNLYIAAAVCRDLRPVRQPPVFSVTASFVGRRNYTADEIKLACAEGIKRAHYGWTYTPDDREADLNVRLFIEQETAYVGVRVAAEPLQNRPYKEAHIPGSLKPPVAAALGWVAGLQGEPGGMTLVDPCCGAGTIVIEAARGGAMAIGGDIDPEAVVATRVNVGYAKASIRADDDTSGGEEDRDRDLPAATGTQTRAGGWRTTHVLGRGGVREPDLESRDGRPVFRVALQQWDARRLPLATGSVPMVATNPPWGRKVAVEAMMARFYARLGREVARVLSPGGRAVVLTHAPRLVRQWPLRVVRRFEISVYGQTPVVMVLER